jgi:hypothetical protein
MSDILRPPRFGPCPACGVRDCLGYCRLPDLRDEWAVPTCPECGALPHECWCHVTPANPGYRLARAG